MRFPWITLFLLLCTAAAVILLCQGPVQSGDAGKASPPEVVDWAPLRLKAEEVLAPLRESGPYGQRFQVLSSLYGTGEEEQFMELCRETLTRGSLVDRDTLLLSLFARQEHLSCRDELIPLLLGDRSYVVRERTLYYLSLAAETRWAPAVQKALGDEDYYVRAQAARSAGRLGLKDSIPALLTLSKQETGWAKLCVLEGLAMLGHGETIRELRELAAHSPSHKERAYALGMLCEAGDTLSFPALRAMVNDYDDRAREIACRYLVRLAPPQEREIFTAIIGRGDYHALRRALERLREFPATDRGDILAKAFELSRDRRKALLSLFGRSEPRREKVFEEALLLKGDDLMALLLEHLYAVNRERAQAAARGMLDDEKVKACPAYMAAVMDAMGRGGDAGDARALEPYLAGSDENLRRQAALAILGIIAREQHSATGSRQEPAAPTRQSPSHSRAPGGR